MRQNEVEALFSVEDWNLPRANRTIRIETVCARGEEHCAQGIEHVFYMFGRDRDFFGAFDEGRLGHHMADGIAFEHHGQFALVFPGVEIEREGHRFWAIGRDGALARGAARNLEDQACQELELTLAAQRVAGFIDVGPDIELAEFDTREADFI